MKLLSERWQLNNYLIFLPVKTKTAVEKANI